MSGSKLWIGVAAVVIAAIAVVAFVAYGHGTSGTPPHKLEHWATSTGLGQDIGTLEGDGRSVAKAEQKGTTTLHTVCAAMADDAQTYNDNLPSPDEEVTQWLAKAYGDEYDAAEACYRGGASLLAKSAADRTQAARLFSEVLQRIAAITGTPMSTTTTTVPGTTGTSFF